MTDLGNSLSRFRRYAALIADAMKLPAEIEHEEESDGQVKVEAGVVWPRLLLDRRAAEGVARKMAPPVSVAHVVDRAGHRRPVYRPLLVYCWLKTFGIAREILSPEKLNLWERRLEKSCECLESDLRAIDWPSDGMTAARGDQAALAAWAALAIHAGGKILGRDEWIDLAPDFFGKVIAAQRSSGEFLAAGAGDNPETHSYHELVVLHAAASYAAHADDKPLAAAVAKNAKFQQDQTQPDHATAQPWGLFAFIWNPRTQMMADQLLHAAKTLGPAQTDGVGLMLMADALYSLRLFGI